MDPSNWSFANTWRLRAAEQQQTFYTLFSDREYDKLDKNHHEFDDNIKLKISFAVFARPYADCKTAEQQRVKAIVKKILRLSDTADSVYIGYTYIITGTMLQDGIIPLIRVKGDDENIYFIENVLAFVYEGWEDFLKNHKLDYCNICYPRNGIYKRRPEGRVSVEYSMGGSTMNTHLGIGIKPSDTYLFFPFTKCSAYDTQISVQWSMTFVTLKKTSRSNILKPRYDQDSLAIWLEILAPAFGKILKNEEDLVSLAIDTSQVKDCVEFFKLFYDTPYSVNGHFAVVTLMKMIATRSVKKLNAQLLKELSEVLKFILNISLTQTSRIEKIVKIISDEDSRLRNVFDSTFNCSYQQIKELKYFDDTNDGTISHVADSIAKSPIQEDTPFAELTKRFLIMLNNIIRLKNPNGKEIARYVADIIPVLGDEFYQRYFEDTKRMKALLLKKSSAMMNNTLHLSKSIENFPHDMLRKILSCVEQVSDKLASKNEKLKEIFEQEFLFFVFQFVEEYKADVGEVDVFQFLVGKFVSKCRAFFIECESEITHAHGFELEVSFFNFVAMLRSVAFIDELKRNYEVLKEKSKSKYFYTSITSFNGIRTYCRTVGMDVLVFNTLPFRMLHEKLACEYLGVKKITSERVSDCDNLVVYSNDSNDKFVVNTPLVPTKVGNVLAAGEKAMNVLMLHVTFSLPL